ncbi:MAG: hypothetical protein LBG43_06755 [Treponema sp.]|jgi:spermidine/putrescine-binding protein|nr:hypothetical protein [Treponema sp.]
MKNLKRRLTAAGFTALGLPTLAACNKSDSSAATEKKLAVYTHQTHLILGDEKKDASGNACRDSSSVCQKILTGQFAKETGIAV